MATRKRKKFKKRRARLKPSLSKEHYSRTKPPLKSGKIQKKSFFAYLIPAAILGIVAAFWLIFFRTSAKTTRNSKLNVLLISLDTTRADRIGCYGYQKAKTPNIDSLATKGIKFTEAYCQAPLTLPSHCSLLTGTYPIFHQVHNNGFYYLNPRLITLAEVLKKNGFKTAAFVSSFILDSRFGLDQGFDFYDDKFSTQEALKNFRSERRAEDVYASFSDWLDKNLGPQFFCWLHFFDPHSPYDPPSPYKEEFSDTPYDGEIAYMDYYLGKTIDKLKEKNIINKTLVIIVGDHGEAFGEHHEVEHGLFLYETTLKVPLVIFCPQYLPQGLNINARVRLVDIMPTILDMLKIPANKKEVEGESLLPFISGKRKDDLPSYIETYSPRETYGWSELIGFIEGEWKYIQAPKPELYNLKEDPQEERNLYYQEQKVASLMSQKLKKLINYFSPEGRLTKRRLRPEEEERIRALGYLGVGPSPEKPAESLPDPKDKFAEYRQYFQAKNYELQGNLPEAAQIYKNLLSANPQAAWNYVYLALVYQKMDKIDEAINLLEEGRQRIPNSLIILSRLKFFYLKAGKIEQTLATCQDILRIDWRDFDALFIAGTLMWRRQKWAKALSYFEKAIEIEPENTALQFRFAYCLAATGKNKEALKIYLDLKRLYPRDYRIYHEIGLTYDSLGEYDKARQNLRRAVELYPSPITYLDYAVILEKTGDLKEAIHYLTLYLNTTPEGNTLRKKKAQKTLAKWQKRLNQG